MAAIPLACATAPSVRADVAPLTGSLVGNEVAFARALDDAVRAHGLDACDCQWSLDAEAADGGVVGTGERLVAGVRVQQVETTVTARCGELAFDAHRRDDATQAGSGGDAARRATAVDAVERGIATSVAMLRPRVEATCTQPEDADGDS